MYEQFLTTSYVAHARKLNRKPGTWIATEDLMAAIVANSQKPIPEVVLDHLRQRLDGTAKKRRGRKKPNGIQLKNALIPIKYKRYLEWLRQRNKSQGLTGWPRIRNATWWTGPPNERAARMVAAYLKLDVDWRHVLNTVSKA